MQCFFATYASSDTHVYSQHIARVVPTKKTPQKRVHDFDLNLLSTNIIPGDVESVHVLVKKNITKQTSQYIKTNICGSYLRCRLVILL